jgi:predicted N-acetyltransferase YhbS
MAVTIRLADPADAPEIGRICFEAFAAISAEHNFPRDWPTVDFAVAAAEAFVGAPGVYGVVAERDGVIVGSNFLREYNEIAGVGPISVDPAVQSGRIGRALMEAVLARSRERAFPGVRLVQAAYNRRSLALYVALGFQVREPLACLNGTALDLQVPGCSVRPARPDDVASCDTLCRRVHGHTRSGELERGVRLGTARVVERAGRITGYASVIAFNGHAVAETNDDLQALIGAADDGFGDAGFLVPMRNTELLRWCLARGLRITQTLTLMTIGLYNEPIGAWLPAVIY